MVFELLCWSDSRMKGCKQIPRPHTPISDPDLIPRPIYYQTGEKRIAKNTNVVGWIFIHVKQLSAPVIRWQHVEFPLADEVARRRVLANLSHAWGTHRKENARIEESID